MQNINDATQYSLHGGGLCVTLSCILVFFALSCVGCRPASEASKARSAPTKSSAELLADGITGKYAVDAGKQAKADIEAIAEKQNAKLEEVLAQ